MHSFLFFSITLIHYFILLNMLEHVKQNTE